MRVFAVLVSTVGLTALLLDTYAYQSVDLHLSPLVWDLLLSGEKTELNTRWQYLFIVVPVIFLINFIDKGTKQNLLIIMVDSLRSDMVNTTTMPNLTAFADNNINYTDNYSTSNNNSGVFGLLYGLPSGYANSIRAEGKSPLLLDTLQNRGYHFGLFSGEGFEQPIYRDAIFSKTQLATIDNLDNGKRTPSDQN